MVGAGGLHHRPGPPVHAPVRQGSVEFSEALREIVRAVASGGRSRMRRRCTAARSTRRPRRGHRRGTCSRRSRGGVTGRGPRVRRELTGRRTADRCWPPPVTVTGRALPPVVAALDLEAYETTGDRPPGLVLGRRPSLHGRYCADPGSRPGGDAHPYAVLRKTRGALRDLLGSDRGQLRLPGHPRGAVWGGGHHVGPPVAVVAAGLRARHGARWRVRRWRAPASAVGAPSTSLPERGWVRRGRGRRTAGRAGRPWRRASGRTSGRSWPRVAGCGGSRPTSGRTPGGLCRVEPSAALVLCGESHCLPFLHVRVASVGSAGLRERSAPGVECGGRGGGAERDAELVQPVV